MWNNGTDVEQHWNGCRTLEQIQNNGVHVEQHWSRQNNGINVEQHRSICRKQKKKEWQMMYLGNRLEELEQAQRNTAVHISI